ncbi:glycogen synthase [Pendulispora albinea]|uniref:Glycogen synthase n=1 Tax=Pendulispora albinea TaxID=2741071 RepID=A0ABZ2LPE4_9BACT
MPRPLRLLMVSSEVETFARTGGLGDVVLGVSRALGARGVDVAIVTPLYGTTRIPSDDVHRWYGTVPARVGWGADDVRYPGVVEVRLAPNVRVFLVDDPGLFLRDGIYEDAFGTFGDNELRFATMSRAALSIAERLWGGTGPDRGPDVIHAHDWHATFALLYARLTMGQAWADVPTVFTIHNLAYQGVLGFDSLDRLALPRGAYHPGCLEHGGLVNLLKGAMSVADRVTTVSPTYAREILQPSGGFQLHHFLRSLSYKTAGILNGIDIQSFDPSRDGAIAANYHADDFAPGRARCKEALVHELGLGDPNAPLFSLVSRLTHQKGIDLLLPIVGNLLEGGARIALVGTGERALERALHALGARYPGRVAARVAFDEKLARRIYAGTDFLLVPSRYEPCGLTQMYAMRYGAIPIVTDVGGLHDTVTPFSAVREEGTGFVAKNPDPLSLLIACDDALTAYSDREGFRRLIARAMHRDFSWTRSADEYLERIYRPITQLRAGL